MLCTDGPDLSGLERLLLAVRFGTSADRDERSDRDTGRGESRADG
ncbi:MAG: hypothetical protein V7646_7450, partial [Pseudonocardia sp.]